MHDVLYPIMADLAGVRERINRYYKIRAGELQNFAHLEDRRESYLCPALVLFSARIHGRVTDDVVSFAEMFQLVYLASTIHRNINEDGQLQGCRCADPRDGCQYPILVGDYLYSRAFSILVNTGHTKYMSGLSEIVTKINEGGILRNKTLQGGTARLEIWREIIRLEKAELLAGCCQMGAKVAGASEESQFHLSRFGHSLGLAVGMKEIKRLDQADAYFNEALSHLDRQTPGAERDNLKNMVLYLMDKNIDNRKMVC